MKDQFKIEFPSELIKLIKIYQSNDSEYKKKTLVIDNKIKEVYGDFCFPSLPKNRTYTLGSFVQSIDGKIAYPESPDGTLVAKGNRKDSGGALADYWILNMLRSVCDAVLMGDRTITREPKLTGHVFDSDLENTRIKAGKHAVPLHVVVSGDGFDFPVNHRIIEDPEIPLLIVSTEQGHKNLKGKLGSNFTDLNSTSTSMLPKNIKGLVSMGRDGRINLQELLVYLKTRGINTMLIESPTFLVSLMGGKLLDELYLNTSSVFIGGEAMSLGKRMESFSVDSHPHCKVISIHSHSDYFFYTRYRMEYENSD
jgi:riboflavin biosynthesis pyrimidine reductase